MNVEFTACIPIFYMLVYYFINIFQTQCVQVLCRDKQILLWVVFHSGVPEGHIACNPIYGRMIGLEEGFEAFVSPYSDLKVLDELYVETDSPDDQEILVIRFSFLLKD